MSDIAILIYSLYLPLHKPCYHIINIFSCDRVWIGVESSGDGGFVVAECGEMFDDGLGVAIIFGIEGFDLIACEGIFELDEDAFSSFGSDTWYGGESFGIEFGDDTSEFVLTQCSDEHSGLGADARDFDQWAKQIISLMGVECDVVDCILIGIQAWVKSPLPRRLRTCVLDLYAKGIRDDVGVSTEIAIRTDEVVEHDNVVANSEKIVASGYKSKSVLAFVLMVCIKVVEYKSCFGRKTKTPDS